MAQQGRVIETRIDPEGLIRRRREDGYVRYTTVEIPIEVYRGVKTRIHERLEKWRRRIAVDTVRARGLVLLADGWKPEAVANELNVATATVQKWRRRNRNKQ